MSDFAFHDMPQDAYPLQIRFYRSDTDALVHELVDVQPGAVEVPPLARELGVTVRVEVELASGQVLRGDP